MSTEQNTAAPTSTPLEIQGHWSNSRAKHCPRHRSSVVEPGLWVRTKSPISIRAGKSPREPGVWKGRSLTHQRPHIMVEWASFAPMTNMQLCPVLLSHHTMSSCLLLLPRESDFSGRVQAPSHTLCLIGWSGFEFYYPSSQGAVCLERCPSRCFKPSANMFNTVLWSFHGSGWLLLKLLSLDITPDFKVQNQEGVPLWAMLLRQSSVRRSQKLDQTNSCISASKSSCWLLLWKISLVTTDRDSGNWIHPFLTQASICLHPPSHSDVSLRPSLAFSKTTVFFKHVSFLSCQGSSTVTPHHQLHSLKFKFAQQSCVTPSSNTSVITHASELASSLPYQKGGSASLMF